jgi:hypothetical protein
MKVPIPMGARLTVEQCPRTQEEIEEMACVPYASVVGTIMYVMVCTQPDISHAMGVLNRYMSIPGKEHWTTVKRVFKYLCGTKDYAICYQGKSRDDSETIVHGFVDAYWVGDLDQRRSTNGYVFKMFGGAIKWMSKRHAIVALSTTKVEYMVTTPGSK